jgi:hypothetical protein
MNRRSSYNTINTQASLSHFHFELEDCYLGNQMKPKWVTGLPILSLNLSLYAFRLLLCRFGRSRVVLTHTVSRNETGPGRSGLLVGVESNPATPLQCATSPLAVTCMPHLSLAYSLASHVPKGGKSLTGH